MRVSELMALLARAEAGVPSDGPDGTCVESVDASLQTIDMILDSIPGARAFIEAHLEEIARVGLNGPLEFEDRELSD